MSAEVRLFIGLKMPKKKNQTIFLPGENYLLPEL